MYNRTSIFLNYILLAVGYLIFLIQMLALAILNRNDRNFFFIFRNFGNQIISDTKYGLIILPSSIFLIIIASIVIGVSIQNLSTIDEDIDRKNLYFAIYALHFLTFLFLLIYVEIRLLARENDISTYYFELINGFNVRTYSLTPVILYLSYSYNKFNKILNAFAIIFLSITSLFLNALTRF